jgi:iron complex transport system substrate-binding protein
VLFQDPQMIVASGTGQTRPPWLDEWRQWPQLTAVRANNLFFIPPDIIQRHTPRIIQGVERLCQQAQQARAHLKALESGD